jgi:hypothetical protein
VHTLDDSGVLGQSVEEIEFLVRSTYRVGVLAALSEEPCDRGVLADDEPRPRASPAHGPTSVGNRRRHAYNALV